MCNSSHMFIQPCLIISLPNLMLFQVASLSPHTNLCLCMTSYIAHPLSVHGEKKVLVPTDEPQSNFKCHNSCIHTYVYTCSVVVVPEFLLRCVVESGQFIPLKYSRQEIAGIPFGNFSWEISTH